MTVIQLLEISTSIHNTCIKCFTDEHEQLKLKEEGMYKMDGDMFIGYS